MRKALIAMLAMVLAVGLALPMAAPASAAPPNSPVQPPFEADIEITSATDVFEVEVGQTLELTATWSTNRDVNYESWAVDGTLGQGPDEIAEGARQEGTSTFTFDATGLTVGQNYDVCFSIWHHQRPDRDATQCVLILVVAASETVYKWETAFAYFSDNATSFLEEGFSRWGWTNGPLGEGEYTFELWAAAAQCDFDKGIKVGTVDVQYQDGSVDVTLNLYQGYVLDETHVYVGSGMFPLKNDDPTVAPGQYYVEDDLSGEIYLIVHAVVGIPV